jgi:3D (Asp-Asp-Asp) domain-containing protein
VVADYLIPQTSLKTRTRFSREELSVSTPIPFDTEYVDDPLNELGTERVLREGKDGQRIETYAVKYWQGEEVERSLVDVRETPPQKQIIARGTKIIIRELPTDQYGTLRYRQKIRVWATSYDGHCAGCRGLTYSGTPVKYGTLAVDPSIIPLGTNVYIPGYGIGRAEDIGGGVRGKRIDLGFDDLSKGWWHAQWVDVYLLEK